MCVCSVRIQCHAVVGIRINHMRNHNIPDIFYVGACRGRSLGTRLMCTNL